MPDLAALLSGDIPHHGKGLEINLRRHDGAAEVHDRAILQPLQNVRKDEEIRVAGGADGGAVAIWVFVDDVVPDADVDGEGYSVSEGGGKYADIAVWEIAFFDGATDGLAVPGIPRDGFGGQIVQASGFLPESESSVADISGHAFGGLADEGELEVVNGARAIGGQAGNPALSHQVDEIALHARTQYVGAHHQDDGGAHIPRPADGMSGIENAGWNLFGQFQVEYALNGEVVVTVCQGLDA